MEKLWNIICIIVVIELAGELIDNKFKQYYTVVAKTIIISLIFSCFWGQNYEKNGKLSGFSQNQVKNYLQEFDENWFQDNSYEMVGELHNYYDEMEKNKNQEGEK